jgi:hypothetical protein
MKMLVICSLFILITASLPAQQKDNSVQPFDTSVLKLSNPKLTWLHNKNHFDVYKATPDNMLVAKPDSSNYFNMPVKKYKIMQKPVQPKPSTH